MPGIDSKYGVFVLKEVVTMTSDIFDESMFF